jgi:hypothetical protein
MGEINKYGIGFWIGGGVYSLINLIMNYKQAPHDSILLYNYLILAVAIVGFTLNLILLKNSGK